MNNILTPSANSDFATEIKVPQSRLTDAPYVRLTLRQDGAFGRDTLQGALHTAIPGSPPSQPTWDEIAERNGLNAVVVSPNTSVEADEYWAAAKIEESGRAHVYIGLRTQVSDRGTAPPSLHAVARHIPSISRRITRAYLKIAKPRKYSWEAELMMADQSFDIFASGTRFWTALGKAFLTKFILLRAIPYLATALVALFAFLFSSDGAVTIGVFLVAISTFLIAWILLALVGTITDWKRHCWRLGDKWKGTPE